MHNVHPFRLVPVMLFMLASSLVSAQTYTITDLGTLGGNTSNAHFINSAGVVVGDSAIKKTGNADHAFTYNAGKLTDLGTLGGEYSVGYGSNASGSVVGYSTLADGTYRAFQYSNGVMSALPTLGANYGAATAVNASGQIVGQSDTSGNVQSGFIYSNGVITDLGNLGGTFGTSGYGINSAGQVVGYSYNAQGNFLAFLWQNGSMSSLGTLGGDKGFAINDAGQITGQAYLAKNAKAHAFVYSNGKLQDIDTNNSTYSDGDAINSSGVIVGEMTVKGGITLNYHAFVYSGGKMQDLNGLIPAKSGWLLTQAAGMQRCRADRGLRHHQQKAARLPTNPSEINCLQTERARVLCRALLFTSFLPSQSSSSPLPRRVQS